MDKVIFSVDGTDTYWLGKFMHRVDVLRVCSKIQPVIPTIGMYEGIPEFSFIADREDFETYILGGDYVKGQDSFLYVSSDTSNRIHARLLSTDGSWKDIGELKKVKKPKKRHTAWTYLPDENLYWVTE